MGLSNWALHRLMSRSSLLYSRLGVKFFVPRFSLQYTFFPWAVSQTQGVTLSVSWKPSCYLSQHCFSSHWGTNHQQWPWAWHLLCVRREPRHSSILQEAWTIRKSYRKGHGAYNIWTSTQMTARASRRGRVLLTKRGSAEPGSGFVERGPLQLSGMRSRLLWVLSRQLSATKHQKGSQANYACVVTGGVTQKGGELPTATSSSTHQSLAARNAKLRITGIKETYLQCVQCVYRV